MNFPNRYRVQSSTPYKPNVDDGTLWRDASNFWKAFTVPVLKSVARAFLVTASRYSPPGKKGKQLGTAAIAEEYYYCEIVDLLASIKDPNVKKRPRREDYKYIREGYKFKIIRNKYREPKKVIGYAKSLRTAKQMARIKNRGLAKYSWGTLLNNFSGNSIAYSKGYSQFTPDNQIGLYETQMQPTFRLLAQKSPNLSRYTWGTVKISTFDMKKSDWRMRITNNLTQSNAYCAIAVRRGKEAAMRQWKRVTKSLLTGDVSKFRKFIRFQINKIVLTKK